MKTIILITALLIGAVASAHIPVTESATILDQNIDGASLAGNYRAKDNCDGGVFKRPTSTGLVLVSFVKSYENDEAGVKSKQSDFSYTYMRRQGSSKFEVKTGTFSLNKLRKITDVKKVDNEVVESVSRLEAATISVAGDLADDDDNGAYAVKLNDDGSIQINGKDCDQRVTLTPTKDTVP